MIPTRLKIYTALIYLNETVILYLLFPFSDSYLPIPMNLTAILNIDHLTNLLFLSSLFAIITIFSVFSVNGIIEGTFFPPRLSYLLHDRSEPKYVWSEDIIIGRSTISFVCKRGIVILNKTEKMKLIEHPHGFSLIIPRRNLVVINPNKENLNKLKYSDVSYSILKNIHFKIDFVSYFLETTAVVIIIYGLMILVSKGVFSYLIHLIKGSFVPLEDMTIILPLIILLQMIFILTLFRLPDIARWWGRRYIKLSL